jgi:RNase adapter protein RapZ
VRIRSLFLDASTDALVRRFSETRRPHPLTRCLHGGDTARALVEAIELERELLADLRDISTVIDTSQLRPALLRNWVRSLVGAREAALTLVFESFAFKHGVPLDADYVFDVRVLPNPFYIRELRPLTGRDAPVAAYLEPARGGRDAGADRAASCAAGCRPSRTTSAAT